MSKPNIVIIMADDMGFGDPTCYNPASKIPTHNMDQIAQEGGSLYRCSQPIISLLANQV